MKTNVQGGTVVLKDCHVEVCEIAKKINISNEQVFNILHEHLSMKKLSARWLLRLLTVDRSKAVFRQVREQFKIIFVALCYSL